MTLQAARPISIGNVATEIGASLPLSLGDSRVRALAGIPSGPISLGNLLGKSAYTPMSGSVPNASDTAASDPPSNYTAHIGISVVFTGGQAPFTYAWSHVSGGGTVTAANASSTTADFTVARFSTPGQVQSQVVQCVVTDATAATLTRTGTVTLTLD